VKHLIGRVVKASIAIMFLVIILILISPVLWVSEKFMGRHGRV